MKQMFEKLGINKKVIDHAKTFKKPKNENVKTIIPPHTEFDHKQISSKHVTCEYVAKDIGKPQTFRTNGPNHEKNKIYQPGISR